METPYIFKTSTPRRSPPPSYGGQYKNIVKFLAWIKIIVIKKLEYESLDGASFILKSLIDQYRSR